MYKPALCAIALLFGAAITSSNSPRGLPKVVVRVAWLLVTLVLSSELSFGQATGPNPKAGPHPEEFQVASVVVGAKRIPTLWFDAAGKWFPDVDSGDSPLVGPISAEIRCFKAFEFCERVEAIIAPGPPVTVVVLQDFDVLRWDSTEIIAVDSKETCDVLTLRVEFPAERVSLDRAPKGNVCPGEITSTSFLESRKEALERLEKNAGEKARKR